MSDSDKYKPGLFIPTLYFIEGLPYALAASVSVVLLQNLGASKQYIGEVTSLLTLPWTLKFIWAPLVDIYGLKRQWILVAHLVLALFAFLVACSLKLDNGLTFCIAAFGGMALASATQDVAMDGYYLEVLDNKQQSLFVGVRNAAYRMAMLFGQGALVFAAGKLAHSMDVRTSWAIVFLIAALVFAFAFVLHNLILPKGSANSPKEGATTKVAAKEFFEIFTSFFNRPRIVVIVLYMVLFRLGDALMLKMAQPFLLDEATKGGLHISTDNVGLIYGGVGVAFLLLGGFIGGYVVSKFGLKRTLMPTALIQNSAILLYYVLSIAKPNLVLVAIFNAYEQLAYGLGLATYTVFLLGLASPRYRSGHYAIATACMSLGVLVPGYFSGRLCEALGYQHFFLTSFVLSIPGMMTIFFLPLAENKEA